jgi:MAF protein
MQKPLLLASSSAYRRALLSRLGLPFITASPDIDESPRAGETADGLARRLATEKARALASAYPGHWVIGSDQVASLADGQRLAKPGDLDTAIDQLSRSSGQTVTFYTGLALLDADTAKQQVHCDVVEARFRTLSGPEIRHYLETEQPFDCAGSFKMEGLGIALFHSLEGRDPNSLVGLPLIELTSMLCRWGLNPLLAAQPNGLPEA